MTKLELARFFCKVGVSVIPIHFRDKKPLYEWGEFGYRPGTVTRNPTEHEITRWFATELVNIGICTGWQGLSVLDFDDAGEYGKWLTLPTVADQIKQRAYRVCTSRGVHVYIRLPHSERARKVGKVDIKGIGGYVLGAGSIHPSGSQYRAMRDPIVIPMVGSLSEVLPAAELLSAHTEQAGLTVPRAAAQTLSSDAWATASAPKALAGAVERIKKQMRIEDLFTHRVKTGHHFYMTKCPLHDDQNPSMWVNTERQICGCMAGCTRLPLDVINLVARLKGVSNEEAIRYLAVGT